jgi:hypothetical protein
MSCLATRAHSFSRSSTAWLIPGGAWISTPWISTTAQHIFVFLVCSFRLPLLVCLLVCLFSKKTNQENQNNSEKRGSPIFLVFFRIWKESEALIKAQTHKKEKEEEKQKQKQKQKTKKMEEPQNEKEKQEQRLEVAYQRHEKCQQSKNGQCLFSQKWGCAWCKRPDGTVPAPEYECLPCLDCKEQVHGADAGSRWLNINLKNENELRQAFLESSHSVRPPNSQRLCGDCWEQRLWNAKAGPEDKCRQHPETPAYSLCHAAYGIEFMCAVCHVRYHKWRRDLNESYRRGEMI